MSLFINNNIVFGLFSQKIYGKVNIIVVKPIKIKIQLFASCYFSLFRKAGTILVHLEWCMIWSTMIFPQMIKHGRYTMVLISNEDQMKI